MISLRLLLGCCALINACNAALPTVTYVCDGIKKPAFHVIARFSSTDKYKMVRALEGNASHPEYKKYCTAGINPNETDRLRLSVEKQHFELCGVQLESDGKKGNLTVLISGDNTGSVKSKVTCDFENPSNTASISTGIGVSKPCKSNQFHCPVTKTCLDAKLRCTGGDKCVDKNTGKEEGCNKNQNGEYNVQTYSVNSVVKWIEFRGFTYSLKNKNAVTTDVNDPKSKSSIDQARSSYVQEKYNSSCAYGDLSRFNTYFNGVKSRDTCFSYYAGLKKLLSNKCADLKKTKDDERDKYFHGLLVASSAQKCSYEEVSSAVQATHSFVFVSMCLFVGIHFRLV